MRKFVLLATVLLAVPLFAVAQSQEAYQFEGQMSSTKENPPVPKTAFGDADILFLVNKDVDGEIVNVRVDFAVEGFLGLEEQLVGMHIHTGAAGVNGPVIINSGLTAAAMVMAGPGETTLFYQVDLTTPAAIANAMAVIANPAGHYVNVHSMTHPGGIMRSQLTSGQADADAHQLELSAIEANGASINTLAEAAVALATMIQGHITEDAADDALATTRFNSQAARFAAIEAQLKAISTLQVRIAERLSIRP